MIIRALLALPLLCTAEPLLASAGATIPEPSNLALFGLGLTGLVLGRIAAIRRGP